MDIGRLAYLSIAGTFLEPDPSFRAPEMTYGGSRLQPGHGSR
jgi:hypothetical protein